MGDFKEISFCFAPIFMDIIVAGCFMTVVVQIGNSDNKLTQGEWAHYVEAIRNVIRKNVSAIHFQGGSDWDAPWQNACWVCDIDHSFKDEFIASLLQVKNSYRQDSIALTWGHTDFLS